MKDRNNKYGGVNMIAYCNRHEAYIQDRLCNDADPKALYDYHNTILSFLQHERLIHLLVTLFMGIAVLIFFCIAMLVGSFSPYLLAITAVLFFAYLIHYFRLENRTQRWYTLSNIIYKKIKQ